MIVQKFMNELMHRTDCQIIDRWGLKPGIMYLDKPSEIYSRLMELRS